MLSDVLHRAAPQPSPRMTADRQVVVGQLPSRRVALDLTPTNEKKYESKGTLDMSPVIQCMLSLRTEAVCRERLFFFFLMTKEPDN